MPEQQERALPDADASAITEIGRSGELDALVIDRLEMFGRHRATLFSIAYRMLGSVADAEDILQDAYIRWQQARDTNIRSPQAFLVTIVSRLCITHLQSARVKREQYFGPWLPEPILTNPIDDPSVAFTVDETLSVAFLMLLEQLTPVERAVFILHEVFEYDYSEIARIIELSKANCRQILHRARQHIKAGKTRFEASPKQQEKLVEKFLEATSKGDMQGLLSLFSKDIVLYTDGGGKASAVPNPIYGPANVARFLVRGRRKLVPSDVSSRIAQINGRPGILAYFQGRPYGVLSMHIFDGMINNIYIVRNPDKLARLPNCRSGPSECLG
jgi:RNA polymerase sigma-70 factor, ECF subfamily